MIAVPLFTLLTLLINSSVNSTPILLDNSPKVLVARDVAFEFNNNPESFVEKRSSVVVSLIDFSFPLTYPTAGTILTAGQPTYVTWNATLPSQIQPFQINSGQTAMLVLGYRSATSPGYHLDVENPLGVGIPIFGGTNRFDFILPTNLTTRTTYLYAFMGSSGNVSPQFTIMSLNGDIGSDPSSSSSSISSSSSVDTTYQTQTVDAAYPTDSSSATLWSASPSAPSTSIAISTSMSSTSVSAPSSTDSSLPSPILASASAPSFTAAASVSKSPAGGVTSSGSKLLGSCSVVFGSMVIAGGILI